MSEDRSEALQRRGPTPFSIWRLLLAMSCFLGAAFLFELCMDVKRSSNTIRWTVNQARVMMFFLFGPAIGLLLGLGIGLLVRRAIVGAFGGFLLPALFDAAIMYPTMTRTMTLQEVRWIVAALTLSVVAIVACARWFKKRGR
jgi:hypothetical protein